jgi:hypothetical protein
VSIALNMRRYNIYTFMPGMGRYEIIRENQKQTGRSEEDYWNECFSWEDLKKIVPHLRSQRWKVTIEPLSREEAFGKIHIFSFTYGINHDFKIVNVSGIRIIIARDFGMHRSLKESFNPIGY